MWWLVLLACKNQDPEGGRPAETEPPTYTPPDEPPDPTVPTDTDQPPTEPPVPAGTLLLCGGGTEGDMDDKASWSRAYAELLSEGDVTGDGLVRVAVLSDGDETDWVPDYFETLGADEAFNLKIATRGAADDVALVKTFAHVDAVFLKGGDQGMYYDLWHGTELERQYQGVYTTRHGGLGGTSAGAMSLSALSLAGGMDLVSADVLEDSHTPYLTDDSDGGTGIHAFGVLTDTLVDTHFSNRGRLARLAGTLAQAIDDGGPPDLLGIGIDEQTCVTVRGAEATVSGVGAVVLLRPGAEPALRIDGEPLVWSGVSLDRLTAGWGFSLAPFALAPPLDAEAVSWDGVTDPPSTGDWSADGARLNEEEGFAQVVERLPDPYGTHSGRNDPLLVGALGVLDAQDSDLRGIAEDALFRALYDHIGLTGVLAGDAARLVRVDGAGSVVSLRGQTSRPQATILVQTTGANWRSLSPEVSPWDAGDGSLHAAGLTGLTLHILFTDGADGRAFDLGTRQPVSP